MKKLISVTILTAALATTAMAQPSKPSKPSMPSAAAAYISKSTTNVTVADFAEMAIITGQSISDNQSKGNKSGPLFKEAVVTFDTNSNKAKAVIVFDGPVQAPSQDDLNIGVRDLNKVAKAKLCAASNNTVACFAHNTSSSKLTAKDVVAMEVSSRGNELTLQQVDATKAMISKIKPGNTQKFSANS